MVIRSAMKWAYRCSRGFSNLLRECLELPVEHLPALSLLLLELNLILISVPVLPLAVTGLVKLNVRRLAEELHVLKESS